MTRSKSKSQSPPDFADGHAEGAARMCPYCGEDVELVNGLTGAHRLPPPLGLHDPHGPLALCPGGGQNPRNAESDGRPLWNGELNPRFQPADDGKLPNPHRVGENDYLVISLTHQFGRVTCEGTRVPYDSVAGPIFAGDSVDSTARDYGVSRKMALVCCWYMVEEARLTAPSYRTKQQREVIDRWALWAEQAFKILAGWDTKTGACPDPPERR